MKKPINVISLKAISGTKTIDKTQNLDNGKIKGISIFHNDLNNTGLVQASLESNGNVILPLHHIGNYRNRETEYDKGYIPLDEDGGKDYTINIVSDENFSANTVFQAVFHYDLENRSC